MGNCRTNAGTATPSSCSSGVTVPARGVPERLSGEDLDVFMDWQTPDADSLLRFEYWQTSWSTEEPDESALVRILVSEDGGDTFVVAAQAVQDPTRNEFSAEVEAVIRKGLAYMVDVVYTPFGGEIPSIVFVSSFATLVAMENQS